MGRDTPVKSLLDKKSTMLARPEPANWLNIFISPHENLNWWIINPLGIPYIINKLNPDSQKYFGHFSICWALDHRDLTEVDIWLDHSRTAELGGGGQFLHPSAHQVWLKRLRVSGALNLQQMLPATIHHVPLMSKSTNWVWRNVMWCFRWEASECRPKHH